MKSIVNDWTEITGWRGLKFHLVQLFLIFKVCISYVFSFLHKARHIKYNILGQPGQQMIWPSPHTIYTRCLGPQGSRITSWLQGQSYAGQWSLVAAHSSPHLALHTFLDHRAGRDQVPLVIVVLVWTTAKLCYGGGDWNVFVDEIKTKNSLG